MIKTYLSLILICFFTPIFGQNLLQDNWYAWNKGVMSKGGIHNEYEDIDSVISFKFRLNSARVDDNFISFRLKEELIAGNVYEITMQVQRDRFAPFALKSLDCLFSGSRIFQPNYKNGSWELSKVSLAVDTMSRNSRYISVSGTYLAFGGEEYLHLGAIGQKFSFVETHQLGLMMADETYSRMDYNAVYRIKEIELFNSNNVSLDSISEANYFNRYSSNRSLIINGGFEMSLPNKTFFNEYVGAASSILMAPFASALNDNGFVVAQLDSNDYRTEYADEKLSYMGNSSVNIKFIRTDAHHHYSKKFYLKEGKEYNTLHKYEDQRTDTTLPRFEEASYISLALKNELQKDSLYQISMMIKLLSESSFGLEYIGVHMLNQLPDNLTDSIWKRQPEGVLYLSDLSSNSKWFEKELLLQAKGGEKFLVLGAIYGKTDIVRNTNFQRPVSGVCGPYDGYCYQEIVSYKDSLFAKYKLDNVVLLPHSQRTKMSSSLYPEEVMNQVEIVFTEIEREEEGIESQVELVQQSIINVLEILRDQDAICVLHTRKNDPVVLEPYPILNRRRIIRKIAKLKTVRKVKSKVFDENLIFFSGNETAKFRNHLIIVCDKSLDIKSSESRLVRLAKNGSNIVFVYIGNEEDSTSIKNQLEYIPQSSLILSDQNLKNKLLDEVLFY